MFCLSLAAQFNQSRLPVSQSVQLCVKWAVSAEATSLADEHSWITSMTTSSTPMKTSAKVIKCHHVSSVSRLEGLFIMSVYPENSLEIFHLSQRHPSTDVPNWTCQLKDSRSTQSYAQGWAPEARIGIWKGCLDLFFVGYFSIRSPEAIFCDDIIMERPKTQVDLLQNYRRKWMKVMIWGSTSQICSNMPQLDLPPWRRQWQRICRFSQRCEQFFGCSWALTRCILSACQAEKLQQNAVPLLLFLWLPRRSFGETLFGKCAWVSHSPLQHMQVHLHPAWLISGSLYWGKCIKMVTEIHCILQ